MTGPRRIQRKRTKVWRMPEGAIYVGRPSVYGNPWTLADASHITGPDRAQWVVDRYERELHERGGCGEDDFVTIGQIREALTGRDLACWCAPDRPCHADVLLRVANGGEA